MDQLKPWLRWLAIVPGALLTGLLLTFPLRLVLYNTLEKFIDPYPELPERILTPLVIAAGFVWSGARVAPTRKVETAVVLFGLWMVLLGGTLALTFFAVDVRGQQLFLQGGGLAPAMAFVGGVIGLLIARHEAKARTNMEIERLVES